MRGAVPKEGTLIGANTEFIPIGAKNPAAAHLFLNYMFRTKVNTALVEWIGYPPVHKNVMEFVTPEMKAWPGFILSKEYLEKCDYSSVRNITGQGQALRLKIWQELKQ
jgi:spermidine/putrescine-binding protein